MTSWPELPPLRIEKRRLVTRRYPWYHWKFWLGRKQYCLHAAVWFGGTGNYVSTGLYPTKTQAYEALLHAAMQEADDLVQYYFITKQEQT